MKNIKLTSIEKTYALNILSNVVVRFKNFDNLSEENRENIISKAQILKDKFNIETFGFDYYFRLILYIYKTQTKIAKLSMEEKLALIIETIDPTFEIYKIYEDNANIKYIKSEILTRFSFYDENLLNLEKMYIKRFYNIDDYSFTKKLEP